MASKSAGWVCAVCMLAVLCVSSTRLVHAQATPAATNCPTVADVRDFDARPWTFEDKCFEIHGRVDGLHVAPPEHGYDLFDNDELRQAYFMLRMEPESGATVSVAVTIDTDLAGIYDGDDVVVVGTLVGTIDGSNAFGKEVEIQVVDATSVTLLDDSAQATPEGQP